MSTMERTLPMWHGFHRELLKPISKTAMIKILYATAVVLLTTWLVAVVIYSLGAMVHVLLISSLTIVLLLSRLEKKTLTQ